MTEIEKDRRKDMEKDRRKAMLEKELRASLQRDKFREQCFMNKEKQSRILRGKHVAKPSTPIVRDTSEVVTSSDCDSFAFAFH